MFNNTQTSYECDIITDCVPKLLKKKLLFKVYYMYIINVSRLYFPNKFYFRYIIIIKHNQHFQIRFKITQYTFAQLLAFSKPYTVHLSRRFLAFSASLQTIMKQWRRFISCYRYPAQNKRLCACAAGWTSPTRMIPAFVGVVKRWIWSERNYYWEN